MGAFQRYRRHTIRVPVTFYGCAQVARAAHRPQTGWENAAVERGSGTRSRPAQVEIPCLQGETAEFSASDGPEIRKELKKARHERAGRIQSGLQRAGENFWKKKEN